VPTDKGAIIFLQMALKWVRYLPQTAAVVKPNYKYEGMLIRP